MEYNYRLENYSAQYKELMNRKARISDSLIQAAEDMREIDKKVAATKAVWLQSEIDALIDPKKAGAVDKAKKEHQEIIGQREHLTDHIAIIQGASNQIQQDIQEIKDEARGIATKAAIADHRKIVMKSIKILKELAAAQAEEKTIITALGQSVGSIGMCSIFPSYTWTGYLGNETEYGSIMYRLIEDYQKRYGI